MTREEYDLATVLIDKINKANYIKDKIWRECPELDYDSSLKQVSDAIKSVFDAITSESQKELDKL
jgi:hypothetical protein